MKSITQTLIAVSVFLILLASADAAPSAPAPLPSAAQEALNKGIIAAKVPDYLLAIRYFQEARKAAPKAPIIYLNLGIAESKIPSRELRAIAWFGAYLAATPDAPNAVAVKEQIAVLDVRNQSNTLRLVKTMKDMASQIPNNKTDNNRSNALRIVVDLWLASGNTAQAQKTADLIYFANSKSGAMMNIADAKFKAGDLEGSKRTLTSAVKIAVLIDTQKAFGFMSAATNKKTRLVEIAAVQARVGDIAGGLKTAGLLHDASDQSTALSAIAVAQAKSGDIAGARKTLSSAKNAADRIEGDMYKNIRQSLIAEAQVEAGDIAGALMTIPSAQKAVDRIQDAGNKNSLRFYIAKAQAKAGDTAGARKTADLISDVSGWGPSHKSQVESAIAKAQVMAGGISAAQKTLVNAHRIANLIKEQYYKKPALTALAEAQLISGDIAGAQKTSDLIQDAFLKRATQQNIDQALAARHDVIAVSDWLKKLDDENESSACPLSAAPFLDVASHLKSLPPSNDPWKVFNWLHATAGTIISAQNVIAGMLKRQAK